VVLTGKGGIFASQSPLIDKFVIYIYLLYMVKKILLIIVLLFVSLMVFRVGQRVINFTKDEMQEELSMDMVSGSNYKFYYPKGWVKGTEEGADLAFFAVNEKGEQSGEGITLDTSSSSSELTPASEDLCNNLAQGMVSIDPTLQGKVISVSVLDTNQTYQGCKIINSFVFADILTTSEVKMIWYKDNRDNTVYASNANYFDSTPEDVVKIIKNSVNAFVIN